MNAARRQRILTPIVILIVGGGLAIWASQRETDRHRAIRQMVAGLCETASSKGDVSGLLVTESAIINDPLSDAIVEVSEGAEAGTLDVQVKSGDAPGYSGATHVAIIRVMDVDRLGLRISDRDERSVILGFWWPE